MLSFEILYHGKMNLKVNGVGDPHFDPSIRLRSPLVTPAVQHGLMNPGKRQISVPGGAAPSPTTIFIPKKHPRSWRKIALHSLKLSACPRWSAECRNFRGLYSYPQAAIDLPVSRT
jgi:hypothetical protein